MFRERRQEAMLMQTRRSMCSSRRHRRKTKVGDCSYGKPGSSRVDNVCNRVLDVVSLRLKNDPFFL
jgi:hypothetical protein